LLWIFLTPMHANASSIMQAELNAPTAAIQAAVDWDYCDIQYFIDRIGASPWDASNRVGVNLLQTSCAELKSSWELYDRRLDVNDEVILAKSSLVLPAQHPYFVLYNRYTGTLRFFVWVDANSQEYGDQTKITARLSLGGDKSLFPTHLMDFHGEGPMSVYGAPAPSVEKNWLIDYTLKNRWYIFDLFLTYDPNDYTDADGNELQINFILDFYSINTASITQSGKYNGSTTTALDNKTDGTSLWSFASGAYDVWKSYGSTVSMVKKMKDDIAAGKFNWLGADNMTKLVSATSLWSVGGYIAGGLSAASVVKRFFSSGTSTDVSFQTGTLTLTGNLTDEVNTGYISVPYSGSIRNTAPLYAYRHPQAAMRKLGLFHIPRFPDGRVTNGTHHLEAASCLIVMNPSSLSQLSDAGQSLQDHVDGTKTLNTSTMTYVYTSDFYKTEFIAASFNDPLYPKNADRTVNISFDVLRNAAFSGIPWYPATINVNNHSQTVSTCLDHHSPFALPVYPEDVATDFTVAASVGNMQINDRAWVYGLVAGQSQNASKELQFGADSWAQSAYWPGGSVFMRDRAGIAGLLSAVTVNYQNILTNTIGSRQSLVASATTLPPKTKTSVAIDPAEAVFSSYPSVEVNSNACTFAGTPQGVCQAYKSGRLVTLEPGIHGQVVVRGGNTVRLKAGVHFISNLQMESGSYFQVDNTLGSTQVYIMSNLTWRGTPENIDAHKLFMAYSVTSESVNLEMPFYGTFVAPYSFLIMGQVGKIYEGQFLGNGLALHQGSHVTYSRFNK